MEYMSVKEAANAWGVTIQMVRRYCQKGMVPKVTQENGGWRIPMGTLRPGTIWKTIGTTEIAAKKIPGKRCIAALFGGFALK